MGTKTKTVSLEQVDEAVKDRRTRFDDGFDSDLIIDHVADAILIIDSMGAIRKFNKQAESFFNYSQDELIGQKVEQLIPERFHRGHVNNRKTYISNPHIRPMGIGIDLLARRKDGTEFPCEASLSPITIANEQYTICTLRDATEVKKLTLATIESEKRYKTLVKSSPYCIHEIDLDGRIISMNPAGLEMMGINDLCEINNSLYTNIVCKDHQERINKLMTLAFRGSESEFEFTSKDGSVFQSCFVPITNDAGVVTHLMGITQDVTDRRDAEVNLQKYEHIVSTSLDLLAFFDMNYIYQAVNDSYLNYFGVNRKDVIGHHASEILGQEVFNNSIKPNMDKCLSGERINFKIWLNYPKNGRRYMDVYYAPFLERDGSISGMTADVRDITEQMQAEEEVKKQRENMAHLVRVQTLGEMAAGIAHEINQPLAAINSYAEASKMHLQSGESRTEKVMELTGKISDQARRAGSVVSRLRTMMQNKSSNSVALDINDLIRKVAELAEIETRNNNCKLIFMYSRPLPRVICDEIQIQQVVLNLINNAIESMADIADDVEKNINVETMLKDDNSVEVCISDNGRGIDSRDKSNIFEAFYTTKTSGLGMGLSICKSIIEDHGGELGYLQNEAGGSRFYFSLAVENSE